MNKSLALLLVLATAVAAPTFTTEPTFAAPSPAETAARTKMISDSYWEAFGRLPQSGEKTHWLGRGDWKTKDDLVRLHVEYLKQQKGAREAMIHASYKAVFKRSATPDELVFWHGEVLKGQTYAQLVERHKAYAAKNGGAPSSPPTTSPAPTATGTTTKPSPPPGDNKNNCSSTRTRAGHVPTCSANRVTDGDGCLVGCTLGAGVHNLNTKKIPVQCDGLKQITYGSDGHIRSCTLPGSGNRVSFDGGMTVANTPTACKGGFPVTFAISGLLESCTPYDDKPPATPPKTGSMEPWCKKVGLPYDPKTNNCLAN